MNYLKCFIGWVGCLAVWISMLFESGLAWAGDPNDLARFLARKSCTRCDLRYENLVGVLANGIELQGSYLFNINLSDARLLGARMESSNLEAANLEPVDYHALGPIFGTGSKVNPDPVVGVEALRAWRPLSTRPWHPNSSERSGLAIGWTSPALPNPAAEAGPCYLKTPGATATT